MTPKVKDAAGPGVVGKGVKTLAAGAGVALTGTLVGRSIDVVRQVAVARLLGPEAFGLYAIGWTVLRIVGVLATLGMHNGAIHYGTSYQDKDNAGFKGLLFQSLGLTFVASVLAGMGQFLAAPWLAQQVFHDPALVSVLRWFAVAFPLLAGLRVAAGITRISKRMRFAVYTEEIIPPAVGLAFFLLLYQFGSRLQGAVVASVLALAVAVAAALYYVIRLFPEAVKAPLKLRTPPKELLAFSLPTALAAMSGLFIYRVDRLFIGYFHTPADVGIYQAASQ
ncbi:MAG: oligosaccharide flippase family protein, partial [Chloroflexi bacterium]|nr:oligosaccharide flippase family protein [Chloroflexota bacterium]